MTDVSGVADTASGSEQSGLRSGGEAGASHKRADYSAWAVDMLARLGTSKFRAKFVLSDKDRAYARAKGKAVIDRMLTRCLPSA
ncbi:hypothetical protein Tam10B_1090 [Bifidobacterium vansinderenii]|uniref:Uncharacterized protein n=1 Tax=Bifidobacterium vansinderenii TaxID=1984871 RepID=A0A229VYM3_9BIFI|nr:hypothetical protein Tam10B_1090 [Bifidobacterium vansinderenii]